MTLALFIKWNILKQSKMFGNRQMIKYISLYSYDQLLSSNKKVIYEAAVADKIVSHESKIIINQILCA